MAKGIAILIFIITIKFINIFFETHNMYQFNLLGYNLTNSLSLSLFDKSLKVSLLSNKEYDKGKLINMMTSDSSRMMYMCQ
jgi:hypothetical protein